ncbi:MAG: hypothetical protein WCC48_08900, partial [Anaeromyxobacteraceae bacterium]
PSFEEALERTSAPAPPPSGQRFTAPAVPELREAARAVPPAIWSGRLAGGEAVELSFGRELSIELRQVAGGVELAVRTSPALTRAARVDLPAFLDTLRGRGVVVVRAEVRGRSHGAPSRRLGR